MEKYLAKGRGTLVVSDNNSSAYLQVLAIREREESN